MKKKICVECSSCGYCDANEAFAVEISDSIEQHDNKVREDLMNRKVEVIQRLAEIERVIRASTIWLSCDPDSAVLLTDTKGIAHEAMQKCKADIVSALLAYRRELCKIIQNDLNNYLEYVFEE